MGGNHRVRPRATSSSLICAHRPAAEWLQAESPLRPCGRLPMVGQSTSPQKGTVELSQPQLGRPFASPGSRPGTAETRTLTSSTGSCRASAWTSRRSPPFRLAGCGGAGAKSTFSTFTGDPTATTPGVAPSGTPMTGPRLAGKSWLLGATRLLCGASRFGAAGLGSRIVWTIHEVYPPQTASRPPGTISRRVDRVGSRLLARASHGLIAHDAATAERARAEFGRAIRNVRIVPHGSYIGVYRRPSRATVRAELEVPNDAVVFLCFGVLRPDKSVALLMDAFRSTRDENLALVVAGRVEDVGLPAARGGSRGGFAHTITARPRSRRARGRAFQRLGRCGLSPERAVDLASARPRALARGSRRCRGPFTLSTSCSVGVGPGGCSTRGMPIR